MVSTTRVGVKRGGTNRTRLFALRSLMMMGNRAAKKFKVQILDVILTEFHDPVETFCPHRRSSFIQKLEVFFNDLRSNRPLAPTRFPKPAKLGFMK